MKKLVILSLLIVAPLYASADAETCVNTNILAHYTPETMTSQDRIIFYVPSFVPISTFEAHLNGKSHAVQYKRFGFLTRAKVIIPDEITGRIDARIGAQSIGACNTPLDFSFTR